MAVKKGITFLKPTRVVEQKVSCSLHRSATNHLKI